eukprot:m.166388 g.166388  ORF g.166388 m.166388 type:complete len:69 (-) comp17752_c2_seq2:63-269(-)
MGNQNRSCRSLAFVVALRGLLRRQRHAADKGDAGCTPTKHTFSPGYFKHNWNRLAFHYEKTRAGQQWV